MPDSSPILRRFQKTLWRLNQTHFAGEDKNKKTQTSFAGEEETQCSCKVSLFSLSFLTTNLGVRQTNLIGALFYLTLHMLYQQYLKDD